MELGAPSEVQGQFPVRGAAGGVLSEEGIPHSSTHGIHLPNASCLPYLELSGLAALFLIHTF